jgi:hypothetical protein
MKPLCVLPRASTLVYAAHCIRPLMQLPVLLQAAAHLGVAVTHACNASEQGAASAHALPRVTKVAVAPRLTQRVAYKLGKLVRNYGVQLA